MNKLNFSNLLRSLALLLMIILLSECKKNKLNYYISDQVKEYTVFQPGTYWVYQNNQTGVRDSVYLTKLSIGFEQLGSTKRWQEVNVLDYTSTNYGNYTGNVFSDTKKTDSCHDRSLYSDSFLKYFEFYFSCEYDSLVAYGYKNYYDSLLLNGHSYRNVREYKLSNEAYNQLINYLPDSNLFYKMLYSRNIGLIKWEYCDGQVWELDTFNINQ